ncbi:MAG: hypothetical protein AAB853_02405 [Patescibacteria group bacterium]
MDNPLCDQRQLEMEVSMRMTPAARLDWLAAAWEFVQMTKGKKPGENGGVQAKSA